MPTYPIQSTEGYPTHFKYGFTEGDHTLAGVADAISTTPGAASYLVSGNWWISTGSADAITLVAPISGGGLGGASGSSFPNLMGQDNIILKFFATTAFAHTITTPANAINGSKHIATFAAAVGNNIVLIAHSGVWYVNSSVGITLT
jgi:hypothetical protein